MTHDYFITAAQLMRVIILFYRSPVVNLTVQDAPDNQRRQVYAPLDPPFEPKIGLTLSM
jgi:hypothetical protein